MNPSETLDLAGIGWPICLLAYQQRMHCLPAGVVIDVCVDDPEVAATIRQLASRRKDRIIDEHREGSVWHLRVKKHSDLDSP